MVMATESLEKLVKDIQVAQCVAKPKILPSKRVGPALGGFSSYIVVQIMSYYGFRD